jgi:uncharacterized protein (DUF924 family)
MSRYDVRIEGPPTREAEVRRRLAQSNALHYISPAQLRAVTMHEEILEFWFGQPGTAGYPSARDEWFRKDPAFDALIRERFSAPIVTALAGGFADWTAPRAALARILLLDQFTRNAFRDTPRAFAGDALALPLAAAAIARGDDRKLPAFERWFMYLPFAHAESLPAQQRALELFGRLRDTTGLTEPLAWAERHAKVIQLFGRFPHRNAILGRESTAEETAFLAAPGSRF